MKFIHTADIHLGCVPDKGQAWSENRKNEIWHSFERLIQVAAKEEVKLLLIAGDLFHRQPLLKELQQVNYLFSKIPNTKIILIAGNHDYIRKGSLYEKFEWNANVFFLKDSNCESINFPELNAEIYGLSYTAREIRESLYYGIQPTKDNRINILLAHGGDEKHIPIQKEQLLRSGFDYIALGHIHKPMEIQKNRMLYPGALEPLDCNDVGEHGFVIGNMEKNRISTTFVPFSVRQYRQIIIQIDENVTLTELKARLQEKILDEGKEHIYRIKVEGFRNPNAYLDENYLKPLGNIIEVVDETKPVFDYEKLAREHEKDLLGCFVREFMKDGKADADNKALQYGVMALLESE